MPIHTRDNSAQWAPLNDDHFQVALIDFNLCQPVAVAMPNIMMDELRWEYRSQETPSTTLSMEELELLLKMQAKLAASDGRSGA